MNCFNKKNQHIGKLETLINIDIGWNCEASVRWCSQCGAVVIYRETDNRLMGSVVKMKFPEVTKKVLKQRKKPKQDVYMSLWEEEWTIKK